MLDRSNFVCQSHVLVGCAFLTPQYMMQIAVHLWATGGGTVSSCTFLIIQDVALIFSSDCFDTCLIKTYKAFIAHSKFVKPGFYKHIQFLRNSFVELCSLDVEKSSKKALVSMQQLAKILQQGLRTRKKVCNVMLCFCCLVSVIFNVLTCSPFRFDAHGYVQLL